MSWKKLILAALLILPVTNAGAQNKFVDFTVRMWNKFTSPKPYLDTAWVYQPRPAFDISAAYKAQWNGIGLEVPYSVTGTEERVLPPFSILMKLNLVDRTSHNLGLYAGYGPIRLGYSLGLNNNNKLNRSFSFDWLSTFYGLRFYYGRFFEHMSISIISDSYPDDVLNDRSTADISLIRVDGYFAFNRKKFCYQAAYKGNMVQKRSAGSIIIGAKYMRAGILLDRNDYILSSIMQGLCGYGTDQVSLGAGYSFNFVPYNKDSFSNVTINLTAIPMLTFVNEITTVTYGYNNPDKLGNIHGRLQPNFIARAAVSYAVGHFHFCTFFDFQYNHFRTGQISYPLNSIGVEGEEFKDGSLNYSINGHFTNWSTGLDIHYRF